MSVVYNVNVRTSRLQQVINAIDAGSSFGVLRLLDAGSAVLSSITLVKPCAAAAAGVATFLGVPLSDLLAAGSGVAVAARCEDSAGVTVISGLTVAASSTADIFLSPTAGIIAGQTVTITSATITGN